jgi:hypothetical protein
LVWVAIVVVASLVVRRIARVVVSEVSALFWAFYILYGKKFLFTDTRPERVILYEYSIHIKMDPVTIALIATTVVSTVSAIVAAFRKNIKKSTCCWGGGSIEFKSNTPPQSAPPSASPSQPPANDRGWIPPAHITVTSV